MHGLHTFRKAGGRALSGAGLAAGLGVGLGVGMLLPAIPWIAALVASTLAITLGGAGFLCSGEVFTASCPCCQARSVATTWRQTFQCRRCQTMCALAALRRRKLRRIPR